MELRYYQREAVDAVYNYVRNCPGKHPVVVIPTAGGKTPILGTLCNDAVTWGARGIVLAHVKELLEQAVEKIKTINPDIEPGVYSAGMNRRDTDAQILVAGIQSVYDKAFELGPFDFGIIDEAHRIPPGDDGMYNQFIIDMLKQNPKFRVVRLTATPYRTKTGTIIDDESLPGGICYEIGVKELIDQGYICPPTTKAGENRANTDDIPIAGGEFRKTEAAKRFKVDDLVERAVAEVVQKAEGRRSVLVFSADVQHAEKIRDILVNEHGQSAECVFGKTGKEARKQTLKDFKEGRLRFLINVDVLTEGFDAPRTDCVVLLRATNSPGLYYQMVGRGFRLHPDKNDCLILDFGGNIIRHGPVDQLKPDKRRKKDMQWECPGCYTVNKNSVWECPECGHVREKDTLTKKCPGEGCKAVLPIATTDCPECGFRFPDPLPNHDERAATVSIISGDGFINTFEVMDEYYEVYYKKDFDADKGHRPTMKVTYYVGSPMHSLRKSEWLCFDHTGWPRRNAENWWKKRSIAPIPGSVAEAVALAEAGWLAKTKEINVRSQKGEYDRIIAWTLDEIPQEPRLIINGTDDDSIMSLPPEQLQKCKDLHDNAQGDINALDPKVVDVLRKVGFIDDPDLNTDEIPF